MNFLIFLLCVMVLAVYKALHLCFVSYFTGILPVADVPDITALAVGFVLTVILILAGAGGKAMLAVCILLMLWNVIQIFRLSHLMSRSAETTAVLKEYELKIIKIYYSQKHRGIKHDDYSFYSPVMCYDAGGQETEAVSRLWSQSMNLEKETEYPVCYSMANPKLFWFPEQKGRLTLPYLTGLCISAVIFVGVLAFYFSI